MSDAATMAIALSGSFAASLVLRSAYSIAVMPGVTIGSVSRALISFDGVRSIRSPAFSKCGWVSCSGWPKDSSDAGTDAYCRRMRGSCKNLEGQRESLIP